MIAMESDSIQVLRDRLTDCYRQGAYLKAAHYMHRLEVLGDRSKGWWMYALMLAGALGDAGIIEASIRVLARDRNTLILTLKSAWSKAVSENHRELSKYLARRLLQFAPNDPDFRVLHLLDALNSGAPSDKTLKKLTSRPLPLKSLDPELVRTLIVALNRAGFADDAGRMLDYLLSKHSFVEPSALEQTVILACSLKRYSQAMALTADSQSPRLRYLRSVACLHTLAWDDLQQAQLSPAELYALIEDDPDWRPSMLFLALMLPAYTNAVHLALARRAISWLPTSEVVSSMRLDARPTCLRVGYLSGDFKKHPCCQLSCPVFEAHDKKRFELIAFDNSRDDGSDERRRILEAFSEVVPVRNLSNETLAQVIRKSNIDILIDMSGHTADSRVEVLAYRPAPVQITWLGFPGGVGGKLADYLVVDNISVPFGTESDFDEALIHMPVSYLPGGECLPVIEPVTRKSQGLPENVVVFACFNQFSKISKETFERWVKILRAVPDSILWLLDEDPLGRERLNSAANEHGVASSRLFWAERVSHELHVQRMTCADLIFDSHPYTMHVTAIDALAAGVPFLTFYGETMAGRVSASLLYTAGLGDCVCENDEDYVRCMVALAENGSDREHLRERFQAARTESPLFDSSSFARYLETAYDKTYERWLSGEAPSNMYL